MKKHVTSLHIEVSNCGCLPSTKRANPIFVFVKKATFGPTLLIFKISSVSSTPAKVYFPTY